MFLKIMTAFFVLTSSSSSFANAELSRGSKFFSECEYNTLEGEPLMKLKVDKSVGVVDSQLIKGCPIAITYEPQATFARVYSLENGYNDFCMYALRNDGTVACKKK